MLKITGALLVALFVVTFGFIKAEEIKNNKLFLSELLNFIQICKQSIRFTKADVEAIVKEYTSQKQILFSEVAVFDENMQLKNSFLEQLGKTDSYSQIEFCENFEIKVKRQIETVSYKYSEQIKLFRTLSILISIGVFIILI